MKPLVILIGRSCMVHGQKEASNWYFGGRAGITFKNGAPVALTDGIISQSEGVATISDANGDAILWSTTLRSLTAGAKRSLKPITH